MVNFVSGSKSKKKKLRYANNGELFCCNKRKCEKCSAGVNLFTWFGDNQSLLTGSRSAKSPSTFWVLPFFFSMGASSSLSISSSTGSACGSASVAGVVFLEWASSARLSSGINTPVSKSRHCDRVATTALRVWACWAAGRLVFTFHSVPERQGRH